MTKRSELGQTNRPETRAVLDDPRHALAIEALGRLGVDAEGLAFWELPKLMPSVIQSRTLDCGISSVELEIHPQIGQFDPTMLGDPAEFVQAAQHAVERGEPIKLATFTRDIETPFGGRRTEQLYREISPGQRVRVPWREACWLTARYPWAVVAVMP